MSKLKSKKVKSNTSVSLVKGTKYVQESEILITGSQFELILTKTYERSIKDQKSNKKINHSIFWSIAFSLLIAILTANFEVYEFAKNIHLTVIVWVIIISCFAIAILLLIYNVCRNHKFQENSAEIRENSIKEIISTINFSENK